MESAEEILKSIPYGNGTKWIAKEVAILAINAARKEAIEECVMIATEGANEILKLIDELK